MILSTGSITALNANLATGVATAGSTVGLNQNSTPQNPQGPIALYGSAKDMRNLMIQVTGTFVASLVVQVSIDGVNWVSYGLVSPITTGVGAATITAPGIYTLATSATAGACLVRVSCSAFTSGTAVVTLSSTGLY